MLYCPIQLKLFVLKALNNILILFYLRQTMQGTVSLRSAHGKYLSAQPDGRAEWNRDHADHWEYFQVEQRHNGKIALKGAHGMYLSAQLDGSVQINRDAAPPGGCLLYTSPSPRDQRGSRMPSSA